MKKIYKIVLIIAVALMVLGVGVMGVTFIASGFDLDKFTINEEDLEEYTVNIPSTEKVETLRLTEMSSFGWWYDVNIVPSKDDDIHIIYKSFKNEEIAYDIVDGVMSVFSSQEMIDNSWQNYIGFFDMDQIPMTIAVPKTVKNVELDGGIGRISCKDLEFDGDFSYVGDASDLMMTQVSVAGTLHLEVDSSSMVLNKVDAASIFADVDCGYLNMEEVHSGDMDVQCDLGDFEFSGLAIDKSLRIQSDCGNIEGSIADSKDNFTIMSQVDIGSSNLASGGSGDKYLDVRTDTGSVHIMFME